MASIFNQFSFVVAAAIIGLLWGITLWRWRRFRPLVRVGLFGAYLALVGGVWLAFRYPKDAALKLETAGDVEAVLHNGQPSFIMFYSDY
jgi:hypothetical protein